MRDSIVALVDLFEPLVGAFVRAGAEQDVECVALRSASLAFMPRSAVSLAVMGVWAEEEALPDRVGAIRKSLPGCPIVVVARAIGIDAVVALMRAGVADVVGLPAATSDVVARALLHLAPPDAHDELIGHSPAMRQLRREIATVAPMRCTVLVTGETGVGKGVVARLIHKLSGRSDRPFVHVDCAALAPSVIESELFGHERGAFTGAVGGRAGRFELAQDGTLFLDEIGDLEPSLQAKLLRVLQDREFERVGGTTTRVMAARVIAATNRDLRAAVEADRFRADLLFRLNVFQIHLLPLRERASDIGALARIEIQRIAERLEVAVPALSDSFYERLSSHRWPGNVRELMNVLERVLIRHQGGLLDDLALANALSETAESPHDSADGECEQIEAALRAVGGNVSRAARRLEVPRSTLRYRIRQCELTHLIPRD